MIEFRELGSWLIVAAFFVAILLLTHRRPFARRIASKLLSRLGAWAMDRARPEPEFDQLADDLSKVLRRERLRADIERLQRVIATDMSMSATRQLGNRLAYEWVLRDLANLRGGPEHVADDGAINNWIDSPRPLHSTGLISSQDTQRTPKVETIDIGWRS